MKTVEAGKLAPGSIVHALRHPDGRSLLLLVSRGSQRLIRFWSPGRGPFPAVPTVPNADLLTLDLSGHLLAVAPHQVAVHRLPKAGVPSAPIRRVPFEGGNMAAAAPSRGEGIFVAVAQTTGDASSGSVWRISAGGTPTPQPLPVQSGATAIAFATDSEGLVESWGRGLVEVRQSPNGRLTPGRTLWRDSADPVNSLCAVRNGVLATTRAGVLLLVNLSQMIQPVRKVGTVPPFAFLYAAPDGRTAYARSTGRQVVVLNERGLRQGEFTLPEPGMLLVPL